MKPPADGAPPIGQIGLSRRGALARFGSVTAVGATVAAGTGLSQVSAATAAPDRVPAGADATAATLAELRRLAGLGLRRVAVLGAARQGDGGGGDFYWDPGSTARDDGGTVIAPAGPRRGRWLRLREPGYVNASWFSTPSDAGAKIAAAIAALPAEGGTVDARNLNGSQTMHTNPFRSVTKPGTLLLGYATFAVTATITIPSHWTVVGAYGGRPLAAPIVPPDFGTIFRWSGTTDGTVVSIVDGQYVDFHCFTIDGNSVAGVTGLLVDSTKTSAATHNILLQQFSIYNCLVGIQWGTEYPPSSSNAAEIDKAIIREFHISSTAKAATGIVVASSNSLSDSIIEIGAIQLCLIGIDIKVHSYLAIKRVSFGSLGQTSPVQSNPVALQVTLTNPLIIEQCESENGAANSRFLKLVHDPYDASYAPLLLINSTINEPIEVDHGLTIISIGNSGAAPAILNNNNTLPIDITSIGDTFNNGNSWPATSTGTTVIDTVKKLTGAGFVGADGPPSGANSNAAPFRIDTLGGVVLAGGIDASNLNTWFQAQHKSIANTYYQIELNPLGGGVSFGGGSGKLAALNQGTLVWAAPAIATGSFASTTVTVPGALPGDRAIVSLGQDLPGLFPRAEVIASDTIRVSLFNLSGSSQSPGTLHCKLDVWR